MRLWLLFAYLAMPIDVILDFLPVVGNTDDAIIVAAVLPIRRQPRRVRRPCGGTGRIGRRVRNVVFELQDCPRQAC